MRKKLFIAALLFIVSQSRVIAQWNAIPSQVNNPISNALTDDVVISSVTDGSGGAIVAWTGLDYDNTTYNISIQRKTVSGAISWNNAATPVVLFTSSEYSDVADVVPDGAGGAYISWVNYLTDTTSDLYLQRVSSTGSLLFGASGIKINSTDGYFYSEGRLCADASGVIISWSKQFASTIDIIPSYAQVFAQRFNVSGAAQWTGGGVQVSIAAGIRAIPEIVSDGSNGAFIAFSDARNSPIGADNDFDNIDIYAQHLSSAGTRLWGATDVIVANEDSNQFIYSGSRQTNSMIADGAGGVILIYEDYKTNNNDNPSNLYAQRLNSSGSRLWTSSGVALTNSTLLYKNYLALADDGANGVVATWDEVDFVVGGEAHGQRVTGAGVVNWGSNGIIISATGDFAFNSSTMTADGTGNYVVNWSTYDAVNGYFIIKGQKLNVSGTAQWTAGGVNICTNPDASPRNPKIIRSSANTTLVAWEDSRNIATNNTDIYAARITTGGTLVFVNPNNFNTVANGNWNNPATWAGNVVPPAGANVFILHNVTGNVNTTCNTLNINSPGILTVNTGIIITVSQ